MENLPLVMIILILYTAVYSQFWYKESGLLEKSPTIVCQIVCVNQK